MIKQTFNPQSTKKAVLEREYTINQNIFIYSGEINIMAHNLIKRWNTNTSLTSIILEGKKTIVL